jgi:hypothetical protein
MTTTKPQAFTQTKAERSRVARNIAEAIDDLYREKRGTARS